MRLLLRLLFLVLLVVGIIYGWEQIKARKFFDPSGRSEVVTNHNVVLQQITSLGKLELVKYNFRDVVDQKITRQFLPDGKALLIIQGEAIGCLDLTKMTVADIGEMRDTLIVRLPEPEICVAKIDHSKSKVYNTEYAFTDEALLIDEAFKKAEEQVSQSAINQGILEQTRENASKILRPMLEKVSGKKVLLRYRMKGQIDDPR
ncbi:DUF4230 domain-containing protein [Siphonobacter sp. SORGH_AS_0500]|uniref:DUF4230 domain-containing protein n=1 Tax=Siphonobacter sp. SORGH_AS_0500 TaxID=1864824 RepID=UPI002865B70C|nr:DUF4230 domain-containing protein [Siphonobacter sp. SORGH_AS_0500]MDR6196843.1 hypothetical protein [Siphonobacter sp. SORGH_AS_0500]